MATRLSGTSAHQFVSPVEYFAADPKMSLSVDNRDLSARKSRLPARSRGANRYVSGMRAKLDTRLGDELPPVQ